MSKSNIFPSPSYGDKAANLRQLEQSLQNIENYTKGQRIWRRDILDGSGADTISYLALFITLFNQPSGLYKCCNYY
jgi:hypothetical protein